MQTCKHRWDVERAAAWLRRHGWGDAGEERAPPLEPHLAAEAAGGQARAAGEDEPPWPALVAPLYGAIAAAR